MVVSARREEKGGRAHFAVEDAARLGDRMEAHRLADHVVKQMRKLLNVLLLARRNEAGDQRRRVDAALTAKFELGKDALQLLQGLDLPGHARVSATMARLLKGRTAMSAAAGPGGGCHVRTASRKPSCEKST